MDKQTFIVNLTIFLTKKLEQYLPETSEEDMLYKSRGIIASEISHILMGIWGKESSLEKMLKEEGVCGLEEKVDG